MPGRARIQQFLKKAVEAHCRFAILEVTSEGIKQHRHRFIDFDVAVWTNLSPEHLEAHGSFENYREAKGRFFKKTKTVHIINLDDRNASYFLKFPARKKYGYRIKSKSEFRDSKINLNEIEILEAEKKEILNSGVKFSLRNVHFNLKLLGEFNIYNALAAIAVGLSQGIDLDTCKRALEKIEGVPGRMEKVISRPFAVFVDYAFTPNALKQVYQTLTDQLINLSTNQLICVLGACGGGRDKWKRSVLGKLAGQYCHQVIVTNEDPYDEEPIAIINQVASGAGVKARKIPDRRKAIREALRLAKDNDIVIITGKGCEPSICLAKGKQIPWDDRQVVREEFAKLRNACKFGQNNSNSCQ